MPEKRPRNIHEIINRFDQTFGHSHMEMRVFDVSMNRIFLQVTYEKDRIIEPDMAWGVCTNTHCNKPANLSAVATLQLETDAGSPRLSLHRDGLHVNSYTMPHIGMVREFERAMAAGGMGGYGDVALGRSLHAQAVAMYNERLEYMTRLANEFARTKNIRPYVLTADTREGQFQEIMREISCLTDIGRYLLFQTDRNGRIITQDSHREEAAAA